MNSPEIEKCLICGHNEYTDFVTCQDFFVTGETFDIRECIRCGFKFTIGVTDAANIARYYKSDNYISHSNTKQGLVNRFYHIARRIMLSRKFNLVRSSTGKTKASVLDIGTGTGYFSGFMQQKGWLVTATEANGEARLFAKENLNLDVLPEEMLFTLPAKSFDAITLWHVMEHLPDLEDYWQAIYRLLKPEGKLIIAVPNSISYDAVHYGRFWAAWDVPRHLWHFGPDQMKAIAARFGFVPETIKALPFDSFYVSMLSEGYKKSSFAMLKGLFWGKISWLASLTDFRRGSSLVYVFRNHQVIPNANSNQS